MAKLFSMESVSGDPPELLIDKVIQKADKDKEGLRVTADLIKQRQRLRLEIDKELKKDPPEVDDLTEEDSEGVDTSTEDEAEESTPEDTGAPESDPQESTPENAEKPEAANSPSGEEDATESAQDADNLESLVGSGLKQKEDPPVAEDKQEKPQVSKESFNADSVLPVKLFEDMVNKYFQHCLAMEEYNLTPKNTDPKDQPVAYVKEEVLASLKKMINLSNRYVARNTRQVETAGKALMTLSESATVYEQCHKAGKLHLTLKVVNDEGLIKALCMPGVSDLKEGASLFLRYLDLNTTLVAKVLENDLQSLGGSLTACGYREESGVYHYTKTLPGFNDLRVSCNDYQDYLRTKYEDYQAYRVQSFKVQELYDLQGISLDKDNELVAVLERLSGIVVHTGLMADNLNDLSQQYNGLIEKVKATCYDIEQGKVDKLPDLDIDARLKDFIRFKIATELYSNAINMAIEYLTAVMSLFSGLIELDN